MSLFGAAAPGPLPAQTAVSAETVGRAYIAAYSAADWDRMSTFMADSVAFVDRTNPDPAFVAVTRGRAAVLAMLRTFGSSGGVESLDFDFPLVFASNNVVVFSGRVNTLSRPSGGNGAYRWRSDQVIALTIGDGKVVRHEDFADYVHPVIERVPESVSPSGATSGPPASLASLAFLLGEWRIASVYYNADGTTVTGAGRMSARLGMGGQAIEMESEHDDPSTAGAGRFHDSHIWMMHPVTGKVVGIAINSLGNRKFNDGEFVDGDLVVTMHGEMFGGGRFINRQRLHRASADRIELSLELSTDEGQTWRDAGYSAVWERMQ